MNILNILEKKKSGTLVKELCLKGNSKLKEEIREGKRVILAKFQTSFTKGGEKK